MPTLTLRDLSEETLSALERLASQHGHSVEDEARRLLDEAAQSKIGLGTALARIGRELGGVDELALSLQQDTAPIEPATFERSS